jgi:hypothetical protein
MKLLRKDNERNKVKNCNRCEDLKRVNKFGVCEDCQLEIDREYSQIYTFKTMED